MTRGIIVAMLFLSGCISTYPSPEESQPHAKLHIVWSPMPNVLYGGAQFVSTADDVCQPDTQGKGLGVVATSIGQEKERTIRMQSGKEQILRIRGFGVAANPTYSCGAKICMTMPDCVNFLRFTPEAGKTYDIQQIHDSARCATHLTEAATNQPPPSLRRYSADEVACGKVK